MQLGEGDDRPILTQCVLSDRGYSYFLSFSDSPIPFVPSSLKNNTSRHDQGSPQSLTGGRWTVRLSPVSLPLQNTVERRVATVATKG